MKFIIIFLTIILLFTSCSDKIKSPLNMPILADSGVNSIDAKTPFKINAIAPKLLGYELEIFTASEGGESKSIMRVLYNDKEAMIIIPTRANDKQEQYVKNISVTSDYVQNPFDVKIGDKYNKNNFSTCQEFRETIICKKSGFDNIELIFNKDATQIWSLKEILWSADV